MCPYIAGLRASRIHSFGDIHFHFQTVALVKEIFEGHGYIVKIDPVLDSNGKSVVTMMVTWFVSRSDPVRESARVSAARSQTEGIIRAVQVDRAFTPD